MQRCAEVSLALFSASRPAVADGGGRAVAREATGADAAGGAAVHLPGRVEMSSNQMQGERPLENAISTVRLPSIVVAGREKDAQKARKNGRAEVPEAEVLASGLRESRSTFVSGRPSPVSVLRAVLATTMGGRAIEVSGGLSGVLAMRASPESEVRCTTNRPARRPASDAA